jgi:hypothetical protein
MRERLECWRLSTFHAHAQSPVAPFADAEVADGSAKSRH